MIDLTIRRCAEALTIHRDSFDSGFDMPGGNISMTLNAPNICASTSFNTSQMTYSMSYCGTLIPVVKPSLLITLHCRSIRTMILPVDVGRQEGIPSPNFNLIVALGHSPLSFALRRSPPQRSIFRTQSLHWLVTGWSHDLSHTSTSHNSHSLDSWQSRSSLQQWAQSYRR